MRQKNRCWISESQMSKKTSTWVWFQKQDMNQIRRVAEIVSKLPILWLPTSAKMVLIWTKSKTRQVQRQAKCLRWRRYNKFYQMLYRYSRDGGGRKWAKFWSLRVLPQVYLFVVTANHERVARVGPVQGCHTRIFDSHWLHISRSLSGIRQAKHV